MKTLKFLNLKFLLSTLVILSAIFVLISCKKDKTDAPDNRPYTLSGNASGSQMVPAVTGSGAGTFSGTYDPAKGTMNYTTNWSNLTGEPSSGGFYMGASGAAGTAVGDPWVMGTDWTGTGTYSGTMNLTPDQGSQLTSGNWYYSMGTAANTGGEIRGQISAAR